MTGHDHMYQFNSLCFTENSDSLQYFVLVSQSCMEIQVFCFLFFDVIYKSPDLINSVKVEDYQRMSLTACGEIKKAMFDLWSQSCVCSKLSHGMVPMWDSPYWCLFQEKRRWEIIRKWGSKGRKKNNFETWKNSSIYPRNPLLDCS